MTNEPENVKLILGTRVDEWPLDGPRLHAAIPVLGRKSVFTTNGPHWYVLPVSFWVDFQLGLRCGFAGGGPDRTSKLITTIT